MKLWGYLLIVELIPLVTIILGGIYETNSTKYEEKKLGYKNEYSIKSKFLWEYSNKLASKIFGIIGPLLFIINAIVLFIFGYKTFLFIILFNLFIVFLFKVIIDNIIIKKFNNKHNLK